MMLLLSNCTNSIAAVAESEGDRLTTTITNFKQH